MEKTFDYVELDTMGDHLKRATALVRYLLTQDDFFTQSRTDEGFTKRFVQEALHGLEEVAKKLSTDQA